MTILPHNANAVFSIPLFRPKDAVISEDEKTNRLLMVRADLIVDFQRGIQVHTHPGDTLLVNLGLGASLILNNPDEDHAIDLVGKVLVIPLHGMCHTETIDAFNAKYESINNDAKSDEERTKSAAEAQKKFAEALTVFNGRANSALMLSAVGMVLESMPGKNPVKQAALAAIAARAGKDDLKAKR